MNKTAFILSVIALAMLTTSCTKKRAKSYDNEASEESTESVDQAEFETNEERVEFKEPEKHVERVEHEESGADLAQPASAISSKVQEPDKQLACPHALDRFWL